MMGGGIFGCSVHTHSSLCDGGASLSEMAAAAYAAGVEHLGFSGHIHTPIPHDAGNVLDAGAGEYLRECARLKAEYAGRMEILTGIEWDSCSDESVPPGLDYWIGSVHNLRSPDGRKYYSVDWRRDSFCACRDEAYGGDIYAMIAGYYGEVARVAAMKPTILGHIDLITKINGDGSLFDENCAAYKRAALSALERIESVSTLLEINTGAVARGYRSEAYPAMFLLGAWRELGGRVIITSDAHSPAHICFGYAEAAERARQAGYRSCAILTAGGITETEI